MAQMGKNKPITLKNLEKICNALECTPMMYLVLGGWKWMTEIENNVVEDWY